MMRRLVLGELAEPDAGLLVDRDVLGTQAEQLAASAPVWSCSSTSASTCGLRCGRIAWTRSSSTRTHRIGLRRHHAAGKRRVRDAASRRSRAGDARSRQATRGSPPSGRPSPPAAPACSRRTATTDGGAGSRSRHPSPSRRGPREAGSGRTRRPGCRRSSRGAREAPDGSCGPRSRCRSSSPTASSGGRASVTESGASGWPSRTVDLTDSRKRRRWFDSHSASSRW